MKLATSLLAAIVMSLVSGCAASAGPEPAPVEQPPPPAVQEEGPFMEPTSFAISIEGSQAELDQIMMPIASGTVRLSSTGPKEVSLDGFEIEVGHVALPQENLQGMYLKDIKVRVEKPTLAPVQESESGTRFTTIETTLVVDCKLVTQLGDTVPLATLRFEGVKFDLGIYQNADGRKVVDMFGGKEGSLGEWAGLGELDNLIFDIHAVE